jgi:FtsP/CotA-like multicopper oxidase with cupredoxin domain
MNKMMGNGSGILSYNGSLPGPTLRLRPGDRLRVQLANRLAQVTNLHVHGLHVSPERNGDNPFVAVEPGSTGNRADVLVTTVQGTSSLQALAYSRGEVMGIGGGTGNDPRSRSNAESTTVATLHVTGAETTPLSPVTARTHQLDLRRGHSRHGASSPWPWRWAWVEAA